MLKHSLAALALAAAFTPAAALAQEDIRIGFVSTFSGPQGVLGKEALDGFKLALKSTGGKLGGRNVKLIEVDDQAKPDAGRQAVDKLIESDRAHIITGIIFSNVMLAVAKPVLDSKTFYISTNAGPSQLAGKQCDPYFFSVSWQNDTTPEAMGAYTNEVGVKKIYLLAPNYPAGKDMLAGFKRLYKGEVAAEVYTTFGQLDYAAEIAQVRAAKPDGVFAFYPGGMGINFVKQYAQAGLTKDVPLYLPSFTLDGTTLPGVGDLAIGLPVSSFYSETLDNAANKQFVADFDAAYSRLPSPYAAQAYDGARAIDAALKSIGGKIEDKDAFRKAMEGVKFDSVRGAFKFNTNHFPIQDYYLTEVAKDAKGRLGMPMKKVILKDHADAYVGECKMN